MKQNIREVGVYSNPAGKIHTVYLHLCFSLSLSPSGAEFSRDAIKMKEQKCGSGNHGLSPPTELSTGMHIAFATPEELTGEEPLWLMLENNNNIHLGL